MATKTVRLSEEVYEMLTERKRGDETYSEAIKRLVGGKPLTELEGIYAEKEVREIENALEEKYE
jgi:predicted CopG family antitoxin